MPLCLGEGFVDLIERAIDSAQCYMSDVTILHVLCTKKNVMYYIINFREG